MSAARGILSRVVAWSAAGVIAVLLLLWIRSAGGPVDSFRASIGLPERSGSEGGPSASPGELIRVVDVPWLALGLATVVLATIAVAAAMAGRRRRGDPPAVGGRRRGESRTGASGRRRRAHPVAPGARPGTPSLWRPPGPLPPRRRPTTPPPPGPPPSSE